MKKTNQNKKHSALYYFNNMKQKAPYFYLLLNVEYNYLQTTIITVNSTLRSALPF